MNRPRLVLPAFAALLLSAAAAFAQPRVGIRHAVYLPKTTTEPAQIELVLNAIFDTPQAVAAAQDKTKYRIVDLYSGPGRTYLPKELTIDRAVVPTLSGLLKAELLNTVQLVLAADLPAAEEDRYILVVSSLLIGNKNVPVSASPTQVTMRIVSPTAVAPQWVKSKDKESSDIYFSGSISRSADTDFYGNADIKIRYPMLERPIRGRLHSFAPSFDLLASANPRADPDSLRLGVAWQFLPVQRADSVLPITRWENAFEQEASRNFDYRTLVWRSELLFLPPAWRLGDGAWFWVNPLVGVAAGSILAAPDDALDTGSLFRVSGGVSATLELPAFLGKKVVVNGEYQIRRQFQEEFVGTLTLGEGSHPWKSVRAEVGFNDYVSIGAVFQDGEQPPKYRAVDRSLIFDLTFKAARKNKAQ